MAEREDPRPEWAADAPRIPGDVQIDPQDDPVGAEMGKYEEPDGDDSQLPEERPEAPEDDDIPTPEPVPAPSDGITSEEAEDVSPGSTT